MKIKYFTLPNIITLGNLLCGTMATICAVSHIWEPESTPLTLPLIFIAASALFDFLDGFTARLTGQYSALGVQLDSLADMVSFGLTPSLVLVALFNDAQGEGWWWLVCLLVVLFSALRLARFNIDEEQKESFIGLPTPALAIAVGSLAWAVAEGTLSLNPSYILAISVVGAWLLISPIRMFSLKFKGFSTRTPENRLRYLFILLAVVILCIGGLGTAWMVILLYIILSIVTHICGGKKSKTANK